VLQQPPPALLLLVHAIPVDLLPPPPPPQGAFFNAYFIAYLLWPKACHSFVGYLEEEAVHTYTRALADIDAGKVRSNPDCKLASDCAIWIVEGCRDT
jgi:hypothetical protein